MRENIAQADISASAQAISVSPTRESGRRAKALCTKRKSASADRYCRPCGATMDRTPPDIWTSDHICTGEFSHSPLRKGNENIEVVIGFAHPPGIVVCSSSDSSSNCSWHCGVSYAHDSEIRRYTLSEKHDPVPPPHAYDAPTPIPQRPSYVCRDHQRAQKLG